VSEWFTNLQSSFRREDILDVAIVAFFIYHTLNLIRGTRAVQILTGLGVVAAAYLASQAIDLHTTHFVLRSFFDHFILIAIVIFQDDLRRALTSVGRNPISLSTENEVRYEMVEEVARAATQLAKERIGALMVIEREDGLKNFIDTGSKLDSRVRSEILFSIFIPASPIHDGAVIIAAERIASAGCFLPLSKSTEIDPRLGTRHRAAIGITEDTDAIVVLVSEEAGAAHLVSGGKIMKHLTEAQLREGLVHHLGIERRNPHLVARAVVQVDEWWSRMKRKRR
jgi:diadenylate cyclase